MNADGEMEIVEGDIRHLQSVEAAEDEMPTDDKLYIAEQMLIETNDMFGDSKAAVIVSDQVEDEAEESESIEHIIIDGQVIIIFLLLILWLIFVCVCVCVASPINRRRW